MAKPAANLVLGLEGISNQIGSVNLALPNKRIALGISLGAIVLYLGYQIFLRPRGAALPAEFSEFVVRVLWTKLAVFVALFLLLRLEGERFSDVGVKRRDWPKHVGVGLMIGFVMLIALNIALNSVLNSLIPASPTGGGGVMRFFKQPENLLVWLPIGIFGGGVVEELERIFIFTRFEKWLGRPGLWLGVGLSSVMFGFGHLYQGLGTAIATGVSGLVFALVYLRRRSALEPIVSHAFSDVLAILAATMLAR